MSFLSQFLSNPKTAAQRAPSCLGRPSYKCGQLNFCSRSPHGCLSIDFPFSSNVFNFLVTLFHWRKIYPVQNNKCFISKRKLSTIEIILAYRYVACLCKFRQLRKPFIFDCLGLGLTLKYGMKNEWYYGLLHISFAKFYSEFEVNIYGYKSEINLLAIHASGLIMTILICKSLIQKPFQQA